MQNNGDLFFLFAHKDMKNSRIYDEYGTLAFTTFLCRDRNKRRHR